MATSTLKQILRRLVKAKKHIYRTIANFYYRNLIESVDGNVEIEFGVDIRTPEKIYIGDNSLIKNGTILDGRSKTKQFGLVLSKGTYIKEYCYLDAYDGYIELGNHCAISQFCVLGGHGGLKIGEYVMIGPHTYIIPSNHIIESLEIPYVCQGNKDDGVIIEDNVWIGGGCIILSGVKIGRNSVIGAGSIVAKDVPENVVFVNQIAPRTLQFLHSNGNGSPDRA